MKKTFTFVVVSCNRLYYLKNCISSILEFIGLDEINLLVIDNGSTENGMEGYLHSLPSDIEIKQFRKRSPHELHRSMNFAIKYSKMKRSQFINFIQEDYQYLYHQPDLLKRVHDAFKNKSSVIQLHTNFVWKRKRKKIGKLIPVVTEGMKWYLMKDKPPCDNGFTRIALYDKIGLYPEFTSVHGKEKGYRSGEAWFARKCRNKYRMLISEPNMGMLMDCAYVRGKRRYGKYIEPPNKYYLKPFDINKQNQVKQMADKNKVCFIEDMIEADGWIPDNKNQKHNLRKIVQKV